MMIGKRTRPQPQPIKRTTSLSEFNFDASAVTFAAAGIYRPPFSLTGPDPAVSIPTAAAAAAAASPRGSSGRRNSCDFANSNNSESFLRACNLCNRRLVPGRDIYMYRGDKAYCSQECRQQQMNLDEIKEKAAANTRCSVAAVNPQSPPTSASQASANPDPIAAVAMF